MYAKTLEMITRTREKKFLFREVMLIDDNKMDRIISTTVIKRNLFAEEVTAFSSVTLALEHLESLVDTKQAFAPVIFLDVNMPGMDGFDFLDHYLKFSQDARKKTTVIMISATNSKEDFDRINDYPAVKLFFNKPLSDKMLFDVRRMLEGNEITNDSNN